MHPPRSRSREGSGASLAELIDDLTLTLLEQRAFRVDQLAQLDAAPPAGRDPARREVVAALRDAARLVIDEIDAALRRIEEGRYGRCRRCGEQISLERLAALPTSTWCGSCHFQHDRAALGAEGRVASQ
jgi:RNA polymerase-binding transcription factor DksA